MKKNSHTCKCVGVFLFKTVFLLPNEASICNMHAAFSFEHRFGGVFHKYGEINDPKTK